MAITVQNPAGRLVTFRVSSPMENAKSERAATELRHTIESLGALAVVCTDLTGARTLAPASADVFVRAMRADNPKIERSAMLMGAQSATFLLQVERMIRAANSSARRAFRDAGELSAWLEPSLSDAEQQALHAFLATAG